MSCMPESSDMEAGSSCKTNMVTLHKLWQHSRLLSVFFIIHVMGQQNMPEGSIPIWIVGSSSVQGSGEYGTVLLMKPSLFACQVCS